ncbi:bacilysin biosynthesis protein BacA [Chengkuizengella axinellae]|uniref:Bacilysin biosynthesis protein BacA n=1 Tax=Chengkuizengella axinellae TaxID=3064388 RepID=A0ABT9IY40_9BACL|nr:bacilysin biosynthesis protein BacA [Chengkuizengella sp. 2205SS18-9]MDP5274283.1 bacilysin biosynthesis protein BacA [Chengkuizengella sp. 2205SS18-9]
MVTIKNITIQALTLKTKVISVGTLGPEGTSSEYAAIAFSNNYLANQGYKSDIVLSDTFEESLTKLVDRTLDYVIVPHAYDGIKNFYMRPEIDLFQLFRCDTPMYGLAVRPDYHFHYDSLDNETVVTHPAPINLVKYGEVIAKVKVQENAANEMQGRIFAVSEALIGLSISIGSTLINFITPSVIIGIVTLIMIGLTLHTIVVNNLFLQKSKKVEL